MAAEKSNKPELVRNRKMQGQTRLAFPSKPTPHGFQMIFEDYSYRKFVLADTFNVKLDETGESQTVAGTGLATKFAPAAEVNRAGDIELPFPLTLQDNNNIRVTPFERDFLTERAIGTVSNLSTNFQGAVQAALDASKGAGGSFGNFVQGILNSDDPAGQAGGAAKSAIKGIDGAQAAAAAAYLGRTFIPGDIAKNVGVFGGTAINPQETLAFTGVDLRNFTFSWDLFPSNINDTDQIRRIVRFLKSKALPAVQGVQVGEDGAIAPGLSRAFLKYPSVCFINLLGVDEEHFVKFKPCMLTQVNVAYGQGGFVTIMNGGVPNSVTLSLSFTEMAIQTADDYEDNASFRGDISVNPNTEGLA